MLASLAAVNPEEEEKPALFAGEVLPDEVDGTRFQVADLIGRGGMGEVYRATRLSDGRRCAVKCVRRDLAQSATVLLRTRFEAKAFRMINHPNVVRILGTGIRRDKLPWMCMEWLEGFTLAEIIELRGKIPLPFAIRIVRDLCQGLQAIHPYAIHRDIKPSNAHLGLDCVTRALDLGAAKPKEANLHLTTTGFQVGTLPFMAPEQLDNTVPIDHRADLWAAVVVLYVLMTGVHPFAVDGALPASKIKLGWSILTSPHRPLRELLPHAPPFCGQIIDRGLAKDPANRHRSAEELVQVLTVALQYLEATTGHAEPLSSLVDDLRGSAQPIVAEPPRLLWMPRTTEPMPPPQPKSQPAPHRARVSVAPWVSPRTTEPMPPPIPRAAQEPATLESTAPEGLRAAPHTPTVTDGGRTQRTGERDERIEIVPAPLPPAVVEGSNGAAPSFAASSVDEVADREDPAVPPRTSDVRLKPWAPPDPTPAEPPKPSPLATLEATALAEPPQTLREASHSADLFARPQSRARQWLEAAGAFGRARWLVVLLSASAVVTAAELGYFFGPWHAFRPMPALIVPADATGEPADPLPAPSVAPADATGEPAGPLPAPTGTVSVPAPAAATAGAPAATDAPAARTPSATARARALSPPSARSRPRSEPHVPVLASPRASPTATSTRAPLFRSQE